MANHVNDCEDNDLALTQEDVYESEEDDLRDAAEALAGDRFQDRSFYELRTAFVMAILSVKYELQRYSETSLDFELRKQEIMATSLKEKLGKGVKAAAEKREKVAAAPKKEKAPKPEGAEGKRGRAPAFSRVIANEQGDSKMQEGSERALVYSLIKKAGEKGITIEKLDEKFAAELEKQEKPAKASRGFVLKLMEKNWVKAAD